jgi:hypothetical protein
MRHNNGLADIRMIAATVPTTRDSTREISEIHMVAVMPRVNSGTYCKATRQL